MPKIAIIRTKSRNEKREVIGFCSTASRNQIEDSCGCDEAPKRTYKTHVATIKYGSPVMDCRSCSCSTCSRNEIKINTKGRGEYFESNNRTVDSICPCDQCN